jgi:hypothetical protein
MPRIRLIPEANFLNHPELVKELANELSGEREFGQPMAVEEPYGGTDDFRVTVFWDKFDAVPEDERTNIILQAYESANLGDVDRIAVALGLTFPEADAEGVLRYEVVPGIRRHNPIPVEQCFDAMRSLGASTLRDSRRPQLFYPTMKHATAAIGRLDELLPGSRDVWTIAERARAW